MFLTIVQHTPAWVWAMFTALVAIGLTQTRAREMGLLRITVLPLLLIALSLSGVFRAFGHAPVALGGWGAGLGAALVFVRHAVAVRGASWSQATRTLRVPGSWLPLVLIVGLFAIKYFAGASLALHPALAHDAAFGGACSFAYGAFGGTFLARALSLRGLVPALHTLRAA
jgi:hypothetical protein